jgi:4-aminobutyrate aminotransferase
MATHEFVFRGDKSRELAVRDEKTLSPSYTRSYGFAISHGKGAEVWDVDGNRYIDFAAGIAVLSTGFSHPRIVQAIQRQAERYIHIGATDFFCPEPVKLAEKLQHIIPIHNAAPDDKRVYFANSGTEAIESALKLARYREHRSHLIAFYGAFHGRTMGSLSLTASKSKQRGGYPYIPGGVTHVPYPDRSENESWSDAVKFIERFVFKKVPPKEVAAVVVEPIQGEGGYLVPHDDFFPRLREMCDKYGILIIADEIQSGIGRTGKWTAIEHFGVAADIVCLAKGLGSGVPIGAMVAHNDIMRLWTPGSHASTFGGNPLACAAALETIAIIEDEQLMERADTLGNAALDRLGRLSKDHPSMTRVDGKGFMLGIDFCDADGNPLPDFRDEVVNRCYMNGLIVLGCGNNGIRFAPPLVLTRELMDEGFDILEHVIAATEEELWVPAH